MKWCLQNVSYLVQAPWGSDAWSILIPVMAIPENASVGLKYSFKTSVKSTIFVVHDAMITVLNINEVFFIICCHGINSMLYTMLKIHVTFWSVYQCAPHSIVYHIAWSNENLPPLPWRHNERDGVIQPFIQVQIEGNIKGPRHWPLGGGGGGGGGVTGDRWIPRTKGQ